MKWLVPIFIHRFSESLLARKVQILYPLRNPRYALTTIQRMYRYSIELGFEASRFDIDFLWRHFEIQEPSERKKMMDRYLRTSLAPDWIYDEAVNRDRRLIGMVPTAPPTSFV